jgi:hypothetical protein
VHPGNFRSRGVTRRERRQQLVAGHAELTRSLVETGMDGFQPCRSLGVPTAGIVVRKARVGADEKHEVHRTAGPLLDRARRARERADGYARASPCRP